MTTDPTPVPIGGDSISIRCCPDTDALRRAVARRLVLALSQPATRPTLVLLSGGSTPYPAYAEVAHQSVDVPAQLHVGFTDDRYVPSDPAESNFHNTKPLIDALGLPDSRVLRVRTERGLEDAAEDYEQQLRDFLAQGGEIPFALLGLGADGHTCSLFTPDDLARSAGRLALAVHRPDGRDGVSVTPELLHRARHLAFMVSGVEKQQALRGLLDGAGTGVAAKAIAGHPSVEIWTEPTARPAE